MSAATYPVRVDAAPDRPLSRWLWLVKWLLAIPHYVVLALLWPAFAVLSVYAFFAILITGEYPRPVFAFNVGVLRWTWRVQYYAYGALGTDRYPPFTLADVPGYPAHLEVAYPARLSRGLVLVKWWLLALPHYLVAGLFAGAALTLRTPAPVPDRPPAAWTGGRIVAVVAGVLLGLAAGGLVTGGAAVMRLDHARDAAGYVSAPARLLTTDGYALVGEQLDLHGAATARTLRSVLGDVRIEVVSARAGTPVFAGVAPAAAVDRYLAGVARTALRGDGAGPWATAEYAGGPPALPPTAAGIWTAQVSGAGPRTLALPVAEGSWRVVVMNADGTGTVQATARASARLPGLGRVASALLAAGGAAFAAAVVLVALPVARASARRPRTRRP